DMENAVEQNENIVAESAEESKDMLLSSDAYRFKLDNFEGPLDLLLHLIKEAKLDITTVKLADITEQYLEYMQDIKNVDMDKASEFITVAATLIEIKSKSVLPVEQEETPDEEDDETLLLRRLEEYKLFKETGAKLKEIEDINKLYRAPGKETEKVKVVMKDVVLDQLLDAFAKLLTREEIKKTVQDDQPKKIVKDRFTVAEKIISIRNYAKERKRFAFEDLFGEDMTKSELINVFLALLELLKLQTVKVIQGGTFGNITIVANEV
ncbi:MAG: segregation/condensation protein A, partial [Clostridia bacterium]|nr:segregation/condensation protein A [Clostridia bacterium]